LFLFFIFTNLSASIFDFNPEFLKGTDAYLNYEFEKADSIFTNLSANNPNEPVFAFYKIVCENAFYRSKGLFKESEDSLFTKFPDLMVLFKNDLKKNPESASTYLYYGTAKALKARMYMTRGAYLSAMKNGIPSIRYADKSLKLDPEYEDAKLALGTFDIFISIVGEHYPFATRFMPDNEYRERGIKRLTDAMEKGRYSRGEASLLLLMITLYEEENFQKASKIGKMLTDKYPDNMEFRSLYSESLILLEHLQLAQENLLIMEENIANSDNESFHNMWSIRLNYLKGLKSMKEANFAQAIQFFENVIENYCFEFGWQKALSWYYIAETYSMQGDTKNAKIALKNCVDTGEITKAVLKAKKK
ncbi:MAG: hypothetical protein KAI81_07145, partial [Candidatus Marinimicrobia bacterium]|nr:hypothetical protein [Candidatus Neomarinimicrobiota bacterium]